MSVSFVCVLVLVTHCLTSIHQHQLTSLPTEAEGLWDEVVSVAPDEQAMLLGRLLPKVIKFANPEAHGHSWITYLSKFTASGMHMRVLCVGVSCRSSRLVLSLSVGLCWLTAIF